MTLVTIAEAATRAGRTVEGMRKIIARHRIPTQRSGVRTVVNLDDVLNVSARLQQRRAPSV